MASAGSRLKIKANAKDPDQQKVELKFWQYPEAGNNSGKIYSIDMGKGNGILIIPQTAKKGETIHLIVEGRDAGTPALIRYQRLIVEVR